MCVCLCFDEVAYMKTENETFEYKEKRKREEDAETEKWEAEYDRIREFGKKQKVEHIQIFEKNVQVQRKRKAVEMEKSRNQRFKASGEFVREHPEPPKPSSSRPSSSNSARALKAKTTSEWIESLSSMIGEAIGRGMSETAGLPSLLENMKIEDPPSEAETIPGADIVLPREMVLPREIIEVAESQQGASDSGTRG